MNESAYPLYPGNWPQNVSRLAKYAVRLVDGEWKITVLCEVEDGLRYLAVHERADDVVERVNHIKRAVGNEIPGGPFYVNEYRHLLVPVRAADSSGPGSHYYYGGRVETDFTFDYEGRTLSSKPAGLEPGDRWTGPRPGIPYVLAAGAGDIYYESPVVGADGQLRLRVSRKVSLAKVAGVDVARRVAAEVARVKGYIGGRFYVNEHGAMFAPVTAGDGNGVDYVFCGQIDLGAWFPEPSVPF
ncbi:MAG TPA: hypothetical protein VNN12_04900 [Dehalococcoidia bacterium]|jgi:hypothetical protein|nr:hypothetical protein [Dehalococcoidia bacterium]